MYIILFFYVKRSAPLITCHQRRSKICLPMQKMASQDQRWCILPIAQLLILFSKLEQFGDKFYLNKEIEINYKEAWEEGWGKLLIASISPFFWNNMEEKVHLKCDQLLMDWFLPMGFIYAARNWEDCACFKQWFRSALDLEQLQRFLLSYKNTKSSPTFSGFHSS